MAAIGVHLGATCACAAVYKVRAGGRSGGSAWVSVPPAAPLGGEAPPQAHGWASLCLSSQDGRADVVANDAGDRVTPAVVAFSESEEVRPPLRGVLWGGGLCLLLSFSSRVFLSFSFRLLA